MTPQEDFLNQIKDLKKQAIRRSVTRIIGDTFIFSLLFNIGAIAVQTAKLLTWEGYGIVLLLVVLAVCLSALIEIRRRRHFFDELIDIDLQFRLNELLSSAYECLMRKSKSIFAGPLVEDASRFLSRFPTGELIPSRFRWRAMSIPVLAIVMILLLTTDFLPAKTKPNAERDIILDQIANQMQSFSKKRQRSSEKPTKKGGDKLYKKVDELEQHLRNRSIRPENALKSLRELLEEARDKQAGLVGELLEELSLQSIETIPSLEPVLEKAIPVNDIKKYEDILKEFFEGEIPSTLLEKILEIKRYDEILQFFSKTMDDIESDLESDSKQESNDGSTQDEPSETTENALSKSQGRASERAGNKEGKEDSDQEDAYTAGLGRDTKGRGQSGDIKASKNTPVKDPTSVSSGKRYNVFIRSLPVVEKARVEPEELIRSYRNEIEEVLTNDKIPLNYREYIKNYFLAIGVKREK